MPHYLITGGAGFIGSRLIQNLLKEDATIITCIDNFDPFYAKEIKALNIAAFKNNHRFNLIQADLSETTAAQLTKLITQPPVNAIIHLAALAGVRPSILHPADYVKNNILGLQYLLDFAKENNVKQFVFASSSSVYGNNVRFPWNEIEQVHPISPYAMTKLSGEMLGHVYYTLYGIRFIALRFFTVYGPGQRPDLAIHKFIKSIIKKEPIPMYGDGNTSRDYTYIDDILGGIVSAIRYKESGFEIINLGNSYAITLKDLIVAIENKLQEKAFIRHLPDQPGDLPKTFADISKAKQLLAYQPSTRLEEGLERFIDWFKNNAGILMNH